MAKPSNSRSSGPAVRPRKVAKNNVNPMRAERKGWKASFRLDAVQGSFSSVKNHLSGVRSRASKILVGARRTRAAVSAKDRLTRLSNLPLKPPQIIRWDLLGVSMSYLWGMLHRRTLPRILRKPMYKLWAYTTKCNLEEMKHPLESYPSMCAFFTRELKEGARLITAHGMASPVDGRVVVAGEITEDQVREVKGLTYSVSGFLGTPFEEIRRRPNTKLYHCVLYLAPGDYHRIHSPTDWSITESRHFPGTLFPIAPTVGRLIPNLLALNERVVVCGEGEEGFYSLTAVGAYNVGSIHLKFDTSVRTNVVYRDFTCANLRYFSFGGVGSYAYSKAYSKPFEVAKGDEIGHFNLGSTVVLIFESEEFEFKVRPGDYIQMGSQLGVSYNTQPLTESTSDSAL